MANITIRQRRPKRNLKEADKARTQPIRSARYMRRSAESQRSSGGWGTIVDDEKTAIGNLAAARLNTVVTPSNHYRLFGVQVFESNPEVIREAVMRQSGHLRTYQLGKHVAMTCQADHGHWRSEVLQLGR